MWGHLPNYTTLKDSVPQSLLLNKKALEAYSEKRGSGRKPRFSNSGWNPTP